MDVDRDRDRDRDDSVGVTADRDPTIDAESSTTSLTSRTCDEWSDVDVNPRSGPVMNGQGRRTSLRDSRSATRRRDAEKRWVVADVRAIVSL